MVVGQQDALREGRRVQDAPGQGAAPARGMSLLVPRNRLMRQLEVAGGEAGTVFLCAPFGFGKTAALLELVMQVRQDDKRASARLIDARGLTAAEFLQQMDLASRELEPSARPLVAVDNVPNYSKKRCVQVVSELRRMRAAGFEVVLSCTPGSDALMRSMGDAAKIGAQAFKVQTREYADWARALAISPQIDMYGYTQGIPAFVAALRGLTERPQDSVALDREVTAVYRAVVADPPRGGSGRLMRAMVLARRGSFAMLERGGIRVREEDVRRIAVSYPVFGLDAGRGSFSCVRMRGSTYEQLARLIASKEPVLAARVARALMAQGRTDDAVWIATSVLDRSEAAALIARFPVQVCLDGHGEAVRALHGDLTALNRRPGGRLAPGKDEARPVELGLALAAYVANLLTGNRRAARALSVELASRADEVTREVSVDDWDAALACRELLDPGSAAELPRVSFAQKGDPSARTVQLRLHLRAREALRDGSFAQVAPELREYAVENGNALDIPALLVRLDLMLAGAFAARDDGLDASGDQVAEEAQALEHGKMLGLSAWARLVLAVRAMVRGAAPVDDGVMSEAAAAAVRAADGPFQLFATVAHGWNDLLRAQTVSAQFRAQQVLRLSGENGGVLARWAALLDGVAALRSSSLVSLRAEADRADLDAEEVDGFAAWRVALVLSAVRSDAELSAWFSRHRKAMLAPALKAVARLALACAGEAAGALRRLLPPGYEAGGAALRTERPALAASPVDELGLGQVEIRLLGGFCAEKNGHVLAGDAWRRRRADALAARLALCLGTFVDRRVIASEMWPQSDARHARENLYMTLSSLRRALGQATGGPTYVIAQGDGIALNPEFVTTDVARFNALARDVLVHRAELPLPQLLETCLKLEELYAGALYEPSRGVLGFFERTRKTLRTKFLDCMVTGASAALEDGQLPVASWLVQAALAQRPFREDVVRCALRVYGRQGRRSEAVALFEEHARLLACETGAAPEQATRELYEAVVTGAAFPA